MKSKDPCPKISICRFVRFSNKTISSVNGSGILICVAVSSLPGIGPARGEYRCRIRRKLMQLSNCYWQC